MKKIEARLIKSHLTHQIRHKILWPHKNKENCSINEDLFEETFHVGVFFNQKIVSVGTFIKTENALFESKHTQYRLRAMGTNKEHQNKSMGKQLILHAIKTLKNDTGLAILIIDKSIKELRQICDRVVILEKGRTVWQDKIDKLSNKITQEFIGV